MKHDGPIPGQSWKVIPCCKRQLSDIEGEELPPNWSLIVWKDCICPRRPEQIMDAVFSKTSQFGHSVVDVEFLLEKVKGLERD